MVNFIDSRNTGEPAARPAESSEIAGFASKNCEKSAAGTEMRLIRLGAAARRLRILTGVLFILLIVACRCPGARNTPSRAGGQLAIHRIDILKGAARPNIGRGGGTSPPRRLRGAAVSGIFQETDPR